jgi:Cu/Ag efflux protein CusF
MRTDVAILLGLVIAAATTGCSATQKPAPPPPPTAAVVVEQGKGTVERAEAVTVTATVTKINYKTRQVTLLGSDGKSSTIKVGPEARNLAQVKKGDQVTVTYLESLALTLHKRGEADPGIVAAEGADRAKLGEKPGGAVARTLSVTATVTKVDRRTQQVTLKGPKGKTVVVTVKDPARLDKVAVGDLVEATYTEAVVLSVDKAPQN